MKHFEKVKIMLVTAVTLSLGVQSCSKKHTDFSGGLEGACIELDITDFGAVGDGVTDDTGAVISAFDTINAHPDRSYRLRFPEGTYPVNAEVSADSVKIVGEGSLIPVPDSTDVILKINGKHNLVEGLSFNKKMPCRVLLDIRGSNNTVDGCVFGSDNPMLPNKVSYTNILLNFSDQLGVGNVVKNSKVKNGSTGIALQGSSKVLDCEISKCIIGILANPSTNNTEIARNIIQNNKQYANSVSRTGADGILGHRNVTKLHIHDNKISNAAEHGIYFQGDNSIIENNEVFDNYNAGIKLSSYNTGLYNFPESGYYIGHDNKIVNNTCHRNGNKKEEGKNPGIVLQAPLINIEVRGNICYDNYYGIRSTSKASVKKTDPEYAEKTTLRGLTIVENRCYDNKDYSLFIEGEKGVKIEGNEVDDIKTKSKSTTARIDSAIIHNNTIHERLIINQTTNSMITGNRIKELEIKKNSPAPHIIQFNTIGKVINESNVLVELTTNTILH